jgi:thiol-disulfide isomerase/thioredoxin
MRSRRHSTSAGNTDAARLLGVAVALVCSLSLSAAERDQHGKEHAWAGATGSYTLIDFAASWCEPCWRSLPHLETLAKQHPKLRVLVVDVDETVAGRDRLVEKLRLTLPVVWDEKARIATHYDPRGMPATFIIDKSGKVIYSSIGFNKTTQKALEQFVSKLPLEQ